jgi:hypothetical protein
MGGSALNAQAFGSLAHLHLVCWTPAKGYLAAMPANFSLVSYQASDLRKCSHQTSSSAKDG